LAYKTKMNFNLVNFGFLRVLRELKEFWRGFFRHIHDHFIPHYRNDYHPYVLENRTLVLFAIMLISVKLFSFAAISFGPIPFVLTPEISPKNIIALTNEARKDFKLSGLKENFLLSQAAQAKAEDMLQKGYFAHNSPDGKTPWRFLENVGYNYFAAGENLAINFTDANSLEQAWMSSPKHKANILKSDFKEIGIGVARGEYFGKNATFVVQMFGVPSEQKIKLLDVPTVVERDSAPLPLGGITMLKNGDEGSARPEIIPVSGNRVLVKIQTQNDVLKILANFGGKYAMLNPKPDNKWETFIDLEKLTSSNAPLKISVYGANSEPQHFSLETFSTSMVQDSGVLGANIESAVSQTSGPLNSPGQERDNLYLWFAIGLLSCLVLAIAIHPKIQHVNMIAKGSLVVILAIALWSTG
jgi:hypothetical protein